MKVPMLEYRLRKEGISILIQPFFIKMIKEGTSESEATANPGANWVGITYYPVFDRKKPYPEYAVISLDIETEFEKYPYNTQKAMIMSVLKLAPSKSEE